MAIFAIRLLVCWVVAMEIKDVNGMNISTIAYKNDMFKKTFKYSQLNQIVLKNIILLSIAFLVILMSLVIFHSAKEQEGHKCPCPIIKHVHIMYIYLDNILLYFDLCCYHSQFTTHIFFFYIWCTQ